MTAHSSLEKKNTISPAMIKGIRNSVVGRVSRRRHRCGTPAEVPPGVRDRDRWTRVPGSDSVPQKIHTEEFNAGREAPETKCVFNIVDDIKSTRV